MKHSKINIDRKPLSAQDVAKGQSFDQLMTQMNPPTPWYASKGFLATTLSTIAVAAAVTAGVFFFNTEEGNETNIENPIVHVEEGSTEAPVTTSVINPPLPQAIKPFAKQTIDPTVDQQIQFGETEVFIPANAIVDAEGNVVKEEVSIAYRDFTDPGDIFLSGIPMAYDSAGTAFQFESAGMFEMRASLNEKELFVAKDKKIDVEMPSYSEGGDFSIYVLDEETGEWEFKTGDTIGENRNGERNRNRDSEAVNRPVEEGEFVEKVQMDSVAVPRVVQEGYAYYTDNGMLTVELDENTYSKQLNDDEVPAIEAKKVVDKFKKIKSLEAEANTLSKPVEPRTADPTKRQIELEFSEKEFPELAIYKSATFEPVDMEGLDEQMAEHTWTGVDIEKKTDEIYSLNFKRPGSTYAIDCYPVLPEEDMEAAKKTFNEKFAHYQQEKKRLDKERAEKQAELEEMRKRAEEVRAQNARARANQMVAMDTAWEESGMSKVSRAFQMEGFGYYNCDTPRRLPKGAEILVKNYRVGEGKVFTTHTMYFVEKGRNATFAYYTGAPVRFNPNKSNVLWGVDVQNNLVYADDREFQRLEKYDDSRCDVMLKVYPHKIESYEDAKEAMNFMIN